MNAIQYSLAELAIVSRVAADTDPAACERLVDELRAAKRIFIGGAGRSLLAMKMFAMRLMQTNHAVHIVGEVCAPSIAPGDLLVAASGKGETRVTLEMVRKARTHGARAALITANPSGGIAAEADLLLAIPAAPAPAADDGEGTAFVKRNLPGNFFETAVVIVADGLIGRLMERGGLTGEAIRRNHANLE